MAVEPLPQPFERRVVPADLQPSWELAAVEVALLDENGLIVATNSAWDRFCADNDGDLDRAGPGCSYLAACESAPDDPQAQLVASAVRDALSGQLPAPLTIRIRCDSPRLLRTYDLLISTTKDPGGCITGASVTISAAESRPRPDADRMAGPDLPAAVLALLDEHNRGGRIAADVTFSGPFATDIDRDASESVQATLRIVLGGLPEALDAIQIRVARVAGGVRLMVGLPGMRELPQRTADRLRRFAAAGRGELTITPAEDAVSVTWQATLRHA